MTRNLLVAVLALGALASCSGAEDDHACAELRRGVEMCDPSAGAGFTCAGLPDAYRACAELVPDRRSDGACSAFMGCLYDGP